MTNAQDTQHTFVLADLAGFTALTAAHGDDAAADVAAAFVAGVREMLDDHEAREVKTMGDAVLVHVSDAHRALCLAECAVGELGTRHGALGIRVGLHTGPAVRRGDDWFGMTVNIAARVAALAEPDEVLLTEDTLLTSAPPPQWRIDRLGWRPLRNVPDPVLLHALRVRTSHDAGLALDPVCRMAVHPDAAATTLRHADRTLHFCSTHCATVFARNPRHYAGHVP
ncbi:adenylate/guanylate cyclase domain-containing protein [Paraconexibacter algicola]|uniref:Guanylate cyclase domain-containing protein n=1 Tax=Paraconexibacter algicola TaxID=2133960 RepID=A0A2T4UM57_9ACTN|nr:adenylate/guanylate cyclase domain-containing protein [Paraconexibacter algicola]PTL60298.1 hypothetical protein C7Y72_11935 [Paraconexibacter algicola]